MRISDWSSDVCSSDLRPFVFLEGQPLAQRLRNEQDIGEQDGGVKAEAADRLQGDLGGQFRRVAQVEEAAGLGPQFAVFRQIAAGLARSEEHTSELQSLMRISYAVFCLNTKKLTIRHENPTPKTTSG